jgi:hypothetical protein
MEAELNFVRDMGEYFAQELRAMGYKLPPATTTDGEGAWRLAVRYWNALQRRITPRARTVHWSNELSARRPQLSSELQQGLDAIAAEVERGDDLFPRLSTKVSRLDKYDPLLNDWGLHHLHLGPSTARGARTGPVLIAGVGANDMYFVDVHLHGREVPEHEPWSNADLLEIVHTNWPAILERFKVAGDLGQPMSPEQRHNVRKKNGAMFHQTKDGTVYAPPGYGPVASGVNVRAIRWADYIMLSAKDAEAHCLKHEQQLRVNLEGELGHSVAQMTLRLTRHEGKLRVIDERTGVVVVRIEPPPVPSRCG